MKFLTFIISILIVCSNAMAKSAECRVEAGINAVGHENREQKHIIPYDPAQTVGQLILEAKTPSEKHRIKIDVDNRDDSISIDVSSDNSRYTSVTGVGKASLSMNKENRRKNGKDDEMLRISCRIQ
jgi:hypothetical protein